MGKTELTTSREADYLPIGIAIIIGGYHMRYSQHKLTGEIDDSQHKLKQLQRSITELQTKIEGAKSRYQRLKDGLEVPRNRSRRFMPGASLLKEAMQEIDSTIFAF